MTTSSPTPKGGNNEAESSSPKAACHRASQTYRRPRLHSSPATGASSETSRRSGLRPPSLVKGTAAELQAKLEQVESLIRDNVEAELKLISRAQELQQFRRDISHKYEKYACELSELTDGEFVPAQLPAFPTLKSSAAANFGCGTTSTE